MGCDIHIVLEKKEPDTEWVGVYCTDELPGPRIEIAQRDYRFFAEIAQVRGEGKGEEKHYARNLPRDVSRLAWLSYMRAPMDYHHASYMSVDDFVKAWLFCNKGNIEEAKLEWAANELLGPLIGEEYGCEFRVVFWFDN